MCVITHNKKFLGEHVWNPCRYSSDRSVYAEGSTLFLL